MRTIITGIISWVILTGAGCTENTQRAEKPNHADSIQAEAARSPSNSISADMREAIFDDSLKTSDVLEFQEVSQAPFSTVSIDVDSASYSRARAFLEKGQMPDTSLIRIEEFINYFDYNYPQPEAGEVVSISHEESQSPWTEGHRIVKIGLQSRKLEDGDGALGRNFVILADTSGSMSQLDKLPLLQQSLRTIVSNLLPTDRISIVTYAGSSAVLLDGGQAANVEAIQRAIDSMQSGGATAGAQGIISAYELAKKYFIPGGINRVILATDGDFNVGLTDPGGLVELAKEQGAQNIFLTILGFGIQSSGDELMEQLSNDANGNYFFIDSAEEAKRVLSDKINSSLVTVAKDVKVQIEFNPRLVSRYRLIGYVNRRLQDEDFNDDEKDAGDLGASSQVTYLYEYLPREEGSEFVSNYTPEDGVDPLNYQDENGLTPAADQNEALLVKVRYKSPEGGNSQLQTLPLPPAVDPVFSTSSPEMRFVVGLSSFAARLGALEPLNQPYDVIESWLTGALEEQPIAYSGPLLEMVAKAKSLAP